ncbi:MAG TPA: YdcF family protein [Thermodesulfobacteriota bacterium]|nr:YdcF family protein [Thermodesulfobacteriota bacterium]
MAKIRILGQRFLFFTNLGLWIALFFVLTIAFTPLTQFMLRPLTIQEEIKDADLVVVLGGGVDQGRYLTLISSHRMVRGIQLYFEGRAQKILFSGGIVGRATVSEASVMNQEARRLKVPPEDILLEKKSKNTHDQAIEVKKIAEPLQMKSILLVTSFCSMKRALLAFEQLGFKVYPAFADPHEKYTDEPLRRLSLFPKLVHEYGGILYYKLRGWI